MSWWMYIIVVVILLLGIYAFIELVGWRTRWLNRKTGKTAESMYGNYADSKQKQRRYARDHGGQWRDDEPGPRAPVEPPEGR